MGSPMKIAVLLCGCGVFDGSEIHESVLSLLAIAQAGHQYQCFAADKDQTEVIDHYHGKVVEEPRNVLVESARIARGEIKPIEQLSLDEFDALWLPGGFGVAKNMTRWAFEGPDGAIDESIAQIIRSWVQNGKALAALCMAPTTVAKALEGTDISVTLTIGNQTQSSGLDIAAIEAGIKQCGASVQSCPIGETVIDPVHKIVTAPCYMMDTSLPIIAQECQQVVSALEKLANAA